MSGGVQGPPGLGGGDGGFGEVGQAAFNNQEMVKGMKRFKGIENNVETDSTNMEKYVKELSKVCWDMFRATGAMLEQEHLRFINTSAAAGTGGNGSSKRIMEHNVIMNLRIVSGDRSLFRQCRQRFIIELGQAGGAHEEIIQQLVTETDLGQELGKVVENLRSNHGEEFRRVSGDVWNVLMDKAENEAYDKINMVPGVVACGMLYRWFTDVLGLGLADNPGC
jgi:hypothetical protein